MARNVTRKQDPFDYHVGQQIRSRRRELCLSQTILGDEIVGSFTQVRKYVNGANRIGASRFYEISQALQTEAETFFQGAPKNVESKNWPPSDDPIAIGIDRKCEKLGEAYYAIPDRQLRLIFLGLLRALSGKDRAD